MTGDLHWLNQRLFPYSLHTPRTLFSTSEKMIYERGCQEKQLPDGRPDGHFCRDSQPLYRYVKPWFRQSGAKSYIFKTVDSETEQHMGRHVPTMDLSEPRRLSLFQVVRGGIDLKVSSGRIQGPHLVQILTLDPQLFRLRLTTQYGSTGHGSKRLMLSSSSVSLDRTILLSSKASAPVRRSYGPE